MTAEVSIKLRGSADGDSAFDAGQDMAVGIWKQVADQVGEDEAVELMAGMFSGAMSVLQATRGSARLAELFRRFLLADEAGTVGNDQVH